MKFLKRLITMGFAATLVLTATPASAACRTAFCTNTLGDNNTYSCNLVAESTEYCYYECSQIGASQ
jgi:hypothetical protein